VYICSIWCIIVSIIVIHLPSAGHKCVRGVLGGVWGVYVWGVWGVWGVYVWGVWGVYVCVLSTE
jgi:hypothetical protein